MGKNELKVLEFKKEDTGVKEVIDSIAKDVDNFDHIMVLALDKEGIPNIFTNGASYYELAYMKLIFENWLHNNLNTPEEE